MLEDMVSNSAPTVTISLVFNISFSPILNTGNLLDKAICSNVSLKITKFLATLGIPGQILVQIDPLNESELYPNRCLKIIVNGQLCRYSNELLQRIHSYVVGNAVDPSVTPNRILAWLLTLSEKGDETSASLITEFISLVALEIVKIKPSVLLGSEQAVFYQASLSQLIEEADLEVKTWPLQPSWLREILSKILDLGISIADKLTVAKILTKSLAQEQTQEEISEALIASLRPNVIEIQLPKDYIKQLTTQESENGDNYFTMMRDGLFYELGIRYPDLSFVMVEELKTNSFAFKINHLTTLPYVGLQSDQCLVNDTPDRLQLLNIEGIPAINPTNAVECSIINSNFEQGAESAGLTTWDQLGYLVLCLAADLRKNSACFIHLQAVQNYLDQLGQAFPALVKIIQEKVSIEKITQVLRNLIVDEISIRNLRLILESLLDYDYIVVDPARYIIFDERIPIPGKPDETWLKDSVNLTNLVRASLKRYISHKYTRGGKALIVYLLHPDIEQFLSKHQEEKSHLTNEECDQILEAVSLEVSTLPATGSTPVILTTIDIRAFIREIIQPEFPRLPVLSYQELSPDMNIQPIARISWD